MKKSIFCIVFVSFSCLIYSQTPDVSEYLPPAVLGPSPTVAAMMRFSEVNVNNYTGIPDISIPIYSVNTHSKDVNINLSLRYNPSGIAYEEESSDVGLGWSLSGGGTISRSVRGYPDTDLMATNKWGLHAKNNPYYKAISYLGSDAPEDTNEIFPKYLWDIQENGYFDSEYDIYQFSFMGYSGKFIITNTWTGNNSANYKVVKIDNNNALDINYDSTNDTFFIYDDKGYKYTFGIKEHSSSQTISDYKYFGGGDSQSATGNNYVSAFHISEIRDRNNNIIVKFHYNYDNPNLQITESTVNTASTFNQLEDYESSIQGIESRCDTGNPGMYLEPQEIITVSNTITNTQKLTQIEVIDIATIDFDFKNGRQDTNNQGGYRLKEITVKNNKGEIVKDIELVPSYSATTLDPLSQNSPKNRMFLSKVLEHYGNETLSYEMDYLKRKLGDQTLFFTDYWGYLTAKPDYAAPGFYNESHSLFCKMDILQKMKLPTGGAVVYQWEPNTYSYVGSSRIENFDDNPENWEQIILPVSGSSYCYLNYSEFDQEFIVYDCHHNCGGGGLQIETSPGHYVDVTDYDGENTKYVLNGGYQYRIAFSCGGGGIDPGAGGGGTGSPSGEICTGIYFKKKDVQKEYLIGGGIRIAKIGYFEGDVHPLYYEGDLHPEYFEVSYKDDILPVKEINYNYHFFEEGERSSGSLAFAKPVFDYPLAKKSFISCYVGTPSQVDANLTFHYKVHTDYNNLKATRTQGSEVGYKNVTVSETGNGSAKFEYRSPIDVPEDSYIFQRPFRPTSNRDDARGLLLKQLNYDEAGNKLSMTENNYIVEEGTVTTGLGIWVNDKCGQVNRASGVYENYMNAIQQLCTDFTGIFTSNQIDFCNNCDKPIDYIKYEQTKTAFAWPKLIERISTNYFYDENNVKQTVSSKELFEYNDINKKIKKHRTETYSSGTVESQEVQYSYYTGTNNYISDILNLTNRVNGRVLRSSIIRSTFLGHIQTLPYAISEAKIRQNGDLFDEGVENVIKQYFSKYDIYGNLLVTSSENLSKSTSYIWGYNNTLPIAAIEGAGDLININSTLQGLIDQAVSASNLIPANDTLLRTRLKAIRDYLSDYLVTTYTHKPLVGMTSVTDAKGITTFYEYDTFNRLKNVKDDDSNLLSENKYNYKPQN